MTASASPSGRDVRKVKGFCGLCIARCGTIATVENGVFTRLDPDPSHPTGSAICAKGRAAPELVYSKERLTKPLRRTNPKGAKNPGWKEIGWDDAFREIAANMQRIKAAHGPEAVAVSQSSASTTAIGDSAPYIKRLMNAFGTPNLVSALDVCGWSRAFATRYMYGVGVVATGGGGGAMADIGKAGCLILWGYNPSISRLTHATATVDALKRGLKLIVIDPRNAGLTNKADVWMRIRPGTDGTLALGLANLMIERGWYDDAFIREWTNAPMLVRADTGRLLKAEDVQGQGGVTGTFVAWDAKQHRIVGYDTKTGRYGAPHEDLALRGTFEIATVQGVIACRPVFEHYTALCRRFTPDVIEATCWIPAAQVEETARLLWNHRPVAYYAWSGHEQHANTTDTARAMALLYTLTGSFDAPGGNVLLPAVPQGAITGDELPAAKNMAPLVGLAERPLGPARFGNVSAPDFYRAVLESKPYKMRGLIGFGTNLLMAHADPVKGRKALAELEFFAHADVFMNPTAEMADIVLPVASCFEREALKIGFEITNEAQSLVQLRPAIVPAAGEAKSDTEIVFGIAKSLGLKSDFWDGSIEASYRQQLKPSGVTLEDLHARPEGVRVLLTLKPRKYAAADSDGIAAGFATPSRKIELWSETFLDNGYSALPEAREPPLDPAMTQTRRESFPLVLTCAKPTLFCQTQHRALPSLRKRALEPEIELHPEAAAARGIADGSWVSVETPAGGMRARARLNDKLDPRVVFGEHGWWQGCAELGQSGYDPFSSSGANYNLTVDASLRDPVSGTTALRASICELHPAPEPAVSS